MPIKTSTNRPTGKKSAGFSIAPLHRYPQAIALLAGWHQREWKKLGTEATLASREQKLRHHLNAAPMPQTFVACISTEVIGSVSIVLYRHLAGPEATPWLANLFVREDWRRCGIGSAMVGFVQDYARQQGAERLYLFTTDQASFYLQRGWKKLRRSCWRGQDVDIMTVDLPL